MAWTKDSRGVVRLLWRRLSILGLLLLVFLVLSGVLSVYEKERGSRALRLAAENQYQTLAEQREKLETDTKMLMSDRGKEEVLRELYAVGKEGEGLIVIVEDKNTAKTPEKKSNRFINFFRNWFK